MSTNLTTYAKNTDYRTMLARAEDPRKILAALFIPGPNGLPGELGIDYPDGNKTQQIERLIEFVLTQFPTLSAAEIRKAFELNDGQKFTRHVQSYGRLDRAFVGAVLGEFLLYRIRERSGQNQNPEQEKKSIKRLIYHDIKTLENCKGFEISQQVDEKFEYLKNNAEDFSAEIDKARSAQLVREYSEAIEAGKYKFLSLEAPISTESRATIYAISKIKAEMVTKYLKNLIKTAKTAPTADQGQEK